MKHREAIAVAEVIEGVDGECIECAGRAAGELAEKLPNYDWFALVAAAHDRAAGVVGLWTADRLKAYGR